ncbi:MAG: hypothetical protein JRJ35_12420 [Deltaproteobacteria bacterium]|nr:hypothetical protein [Deltaproteobacteria bacterium]MBW1924267.1 hypothetical protein [Deltaproteobacteria bacterium]
MNILYLTQSGGFRLFWDLAKAVSERTGGKAGFYVADSRFYEAYKRSSQEASDIEAAPTVKEWEIIAAARRETPDIAFLAVKEKELGDPVLWNALVADRRIYLGKRATLEQDYRPQFSHDRMLSILQVAIREMEHLFDQIQPNAVVGFICVTIGEYLAYLIAKNRRIPFVNLRPTRIRNYFFAGEGVSEPSERLRRHYEGMRQGSGRAKVLETAQDVLQAMRSGNAMYEGVLPAGPARQTAMGGGDGKWRRRLGMMGRIPKDFWDCRFGAFRYDTHYKGPFHPLFFKAVKQPSRRMGYGRYLRGRYVSRGDLPRMQYAFFPLHKEPEVTLLVYSRPFMNQIEVVRNLARSLPVGMRLVVKEHPACVGYRPLQYYRKLLEIPNVVMVPPEMDSRSVLEHTSLVCIISGSIGLEALVMKKPVVHLGRVPFEILPDRMIQRIRDPEQTAAVVQEMLSSHRHDEDALVSFIGAVIDLSVPVDFYSILLGRTGVYRSPAGREETFEAQINRLSAYVIHTIQESQA